MSDDNLWSKCVVTYNLILNTIDTYFFYIYIYIFLNIYLFFIRTLYFILQMFNNFKKFDLNLICNIQLSQNYFLTLQFIDFKRCEKFFDFIINYYFY